MNAFGRCLGGGRRAAPREAASLLAVYTTVTRSHTALLVDVSSSGARLRTPNLPSEGDELFVTIGKVKAFGTVAWASSGQFAMAFDDPLGADELEMLHQNVRACFGFTPEVKAAIDDWVLGSR